MPTMKNMKDLEKYLQAKINKSLQTEVFEEVRDVEQKNIDQTVYDSYTPKVYERREILDGLIADKNIEGALVRDGVLKVKNVASPSPSLIGDNPQTPFPTWVEYGKSPMVHGIDKDNFYIDKSERFPARPFTRNTIDDLERNKQHVKAMKNGLKKQGLDIK